MSTAQVRAVSNKGLSATEVTGPPNFYDLALAPANMTTSSVASGLSYLFGLDGSGDMSKLTPTLFINTIPQSTFNGSIKGARFTSTSATSAEVQDWTFFHTASNTGSSSLITTVGNQLTLLASGARDATGTYSTNAAGFRIIADNSAYQMFGFAQGTGQYKPFKFRTGATSATEITQDITGNFYPTTDNTNTLGKAANQWSAGYFKNGIYVNSGSSGSIQLVTWGAAPYQIVWNSTYTMLRFGVSSELKISSNYLEAAREIVDLDDVFEEPGDYPVQNSRKVYNCILSSGTQEYELPNATIGCELTFIRSDAGTFKIIPPSGVQIAISGTGRTTLTTGYITLDAIDTKVEIMRLSATIWIATFTGTVTVV